MIKCEKGENGPVAICPRWPYRSVYISECAYQGLLTAQENLNAHRINLVLTRGCENQGIILKSFHALARILGAVIFILLYPRRIFEVTQIFSTNGHTRSGDCIDVDVVCDGKPVILLPFGVFTRQATIRKQHALHKSTLEVVWRSLETVGFKIHANATEAMQIHCEWAG